MRNWMHVGVGVVLLSILGFGGKLIHDLNADAIELEFTSVLAQRGQTVSTDQGCIACHTLDGSPGIGPTWLGMFGRTETLVDGSTVVVDDEYFRDSIRNPEKQLVAGYPNVMLRYFLEEEDLEALLEFARQLAIEEE